LHGPLDAVVIGPSNPMLSIAPILALPGVRDRLSSLDVPKIAVSPLIGGKAIKGPADKLMRELGYETSTRGIATFYEDVINGIVVDSRDAAESMPPGMPDLAVHATDTLMKSQADRERVARAVLELATRMKAQSQAR
jgi:LPPG:FO 2-phospho-L-lactate transferase